MVKGCSVRCPTIKDWPVEKWDGYIKITSTQRTRQLLPLVNLLE